MPISRKPKKNISKRKKTKKRSVKKQKGGFNLFKKKQKPTVSTNYTPSNVIPTVSQNVIPPISPDTSTNVVPTVSQNVIPTISPDSSANVVPTVSEENKDENEVIVGSNSVSEDDNESDDEDDKESDDEDDNNNEVNESIKIIEQFMETDCNNAMLKDLMFIAKDINKLILEILPLFDEELVDIIVIFLANFNKKFAEDEDFRNQLNIAIENVINTIINSGMDALGSGCGVIVKILTTMAQAIPGAGAVISGLMIANNIADTGELISISGKNISKATDDFSGKISQLMGSINDSIPKIDNSNFNFKEILENKRQEARFLKSKKEKKKKENKNNLVEDTKNSKETQPSEEITSNNKQEEQKQQ